MWKPVALVVLALALEGAFVLNAVVPDPSAMARARVEAGPRPPDVALAGLPSPSISPGAIARAR